MSVNPYALLLLVVVLVPQIICGNKAKHVGCVARINEVYCLSGEDPGYYSFHGKKLIIIKSSEEDGCSRADYGSIVTVVNLENAKANKDGLFLIGGSKCVNEASVCVCAGQMLHNNPAIKSGAYAVDKHQIVFQATAGNDNNHATS